MRSTCALVVWLILAGLLLAQEASPPTAAEIEKLIKQLDADAFDTREAASAALLKIGEPARESLQQAIKTTNSVEVKTRATRVLEQLRIERLRKNAFKLDAVYQLARDICDKKAKPADLEPVLENLLDTISATNGDALVAHPVRLSDCSSSGDGSGELRKKLLINQGNIAHLMQSAAVLDAGGHISHAQDAIIVAWGAVDISHARNSIVIAGSDVSIAHAHNSLILSGGAIDISHIRNCTLGAADELNASSLSEQCFFINKQGPDRGQFVPGRAGEAVVIGMPNLALRERVLLENSLKDKLTPTFLSGRFLLFKAPGYAGEFVARPGEDILDPSGKPITGLEGWKLTVATTAFVILEKGDKRALVRASPPARGE